MKFRAILISIIVLAFASCEDNIDPVGMSTLPDEDKINVYTDTFSFDAVTVKLDSIYAKTVNGLLGEFEDPLFGNLKTSYACQFYSSDINVFPDSIIDNKIDSVILRIYYNSWIGDSLSPMEVSIYPIVKSLDSHYYTNIDLTQFCDIKNPLGKQAYTAKNQTFSDSVRKADGLRAISVKLSESLGYKFLEEWRKPKPNAYSTLESFTDFFKGVYVTTTYGSGNILNNINYTDIYVYCKTPMKTKAIDGTDSTYIKVDTTLFNVTKEVIQLNNYKSTLDEQLLAPNPDKAFIKTPAGIFTKLIIPIPKLVEKMGTKKFSSVKLSLTTYPSDDSNYSFPDLGSSGVNMLLINPDSIIKFFENKEVANNVTTYTTTLNNHSYSYSNIAKVVQNAMKNAPDKNLELLVVPVQISTYYDSYTKRYLPYATSNYLSPAKLTLKKTPELLRFSVVATDTDVNNLGK